MPYLTPVTAKDEAYEMVTASFTDWLLSVGKDCDIRYQGKASAERPADYWVRLSMQQVLSPQRGFVLTEDNADANVFETSGLIFGQLNAAISAEDSFRNGDLMATAIRDILRQSSTPSGMWFRNARFNELPDDGQNYRWNVIAEYEFDEKGS
jgi:hypothetical protein